MADKDFIVKNSIVANSNFKANSTAVYLGDIATQYATVNSTVYTGTANNTMYVNVTPVSAVVNSVTLTANLADYARLSNLNDSTPAIFVQNVEIRSATLVINTSSQVIANNGPGVAGQVLLSNGTGVYWGTVTGSTIAAPGGAESDTYMIYNNAGGFGAAAGLQFNNTSNTVTIGNSTVNASINSTYYTGTANNADYLGTVAADQYQLNSTLAANVAWMTAGDSNKLGGTTATNFITTSGDKTITGQLTLGGGANLTFSNGSASGKLFANTTNVYFTGVALNVLNVGDVSATNIVTGTQLTSNLSYYAPKDTQWADTQYTLINRRTYNWGGMFYSNTENALLGQSTKASGVYGITYAELHDVDDPDDYNARGENANLVRFAYAGAFEARGDSANAHGVLGYGNNGIGAVAHSNRNHGLLSQCWGNNYCWAIYADGNPRAADSSGGNGTDDGNGTCGGMIAIANNGTAIAGASASGFLIDTWKEGSYGEKFFRVYNSGIAQCTDELRIKYSSTGNQARTLMFQDMHIDPNGGAVDSGAAEARITFNIRDYGDVYFFCHAGGGKQLGIWDGPNNRMRWITDNDGNFTARGNVGAFSDIKLKKDVTTIDNALDKVSKMRGVMFTRKDTDQKSTGVIAQEIQEVLPEVVNTDSEGTLSVAYGNIVGVLIEAIKELKAEIEQLKGK